MVKKKDRSKIWTHRNLLCEPIRLEYDFQRREGYLWMAEGNCCDMPGCIEIFEAIDDEVLKIQTFAGSNPDTVYTRKDRGDWKAYMRRV
jgi:hypothetical protein